MNPSRKQENPATDARSYGFWAEERVRFADLDMLGHVNNKAYFTYAETARVAFLSASGLWRPGHFRQNVVGRAELDYLRELHFPANLRIGVRITKVGNTSFTIGMGMFNGDVCIATAVTLMVRINTQTRTPVPLDDEEKAMLKPFLSAELR